MDSIWPMRVSIIVRWVVSGPSAAQSDSIILAEIRSSSESTCVWICAIRACSRFNFLSTAASWCSINLIKSSMESGLLLGSDNGLTKLSAVCIVLVVSVTEEAVERVCLIVEFCWEGGLDVVGDLGTEDGANATPRVGSDGNLETS